MTDYKYLLERWIDAVRPSDTTMLMVTEDDYKAIIQALSCMIDRQDEWQPLDTFARKKNKEILVRHQTELWVVRAEFSFEQEHMDGFPVGSPYWYLHDLTNDRPIEHEWMDLEWKPLSENPHSPDEVS